MQLIVLATGLAVVIAVTVILLLRADFTDVEYWKSLGYPGVLFLSFLGAVSMVLPVPGLIAMCGVSTVLNPFVLGLLHGLGEAAGETSGYAVGYGGSPVIEKRRFYRRAKRWMERRGTVALFAVSAIPNPFVDIVGIAAGGVKYPFKRFLVTVWVGKTIKGLLVAYSCHYGIDLLPWVSS
ncbi:MAG: VTT domain-containing protein [Chloroflexi bacterium]|nr:VTT domain-containing protein [Chloroflexota bacterium]